MIWATRSRPAAAGEENVDNRADRGTEETTVPLRLATWNMNHWRNG
jgi:hypothetical protein